ncbi:MAG: hypothetical protein V4479_07480 [Actinomycetota bacterium]
MAWTEAQRDELQAAIATGLLTVRYEGPPAREQTYQSLPAMRALLAEMNRQLNKTPTFRLGTTQSGLNTGPGRRGFDDGGSEGGL